MKAVITEKAGNLKREAMEMAAPLKSVATKVILEIKRTNLGMVMDYRHEFKEEGDKKKQSKQPIEQVTTIKVTLVNLILHQIQPQSY